MPITEPRPTTFTNNPAEVAKGAAKVLTVAAALYGVNSAAEQLMGDHNPVADGDAAVTQKVALNQENSILTNGTATVEFGDGKRAVIKSPILASDSVVLERTEGDKGQEDVVSAYRAGDGGENNAEKIEYKGADGQPLTATEAMEQSNPKRLNVDVETQKLVVSEGQVGAGEPVAVGVQQHAVEKTVTTYENNGQK